MVTAIVYNIQVAIEVTDLMRNVIRAEEEKRSNGARLNVEVFGVLLQSCRTVFKVSDTVEKEAPNLKVKPQDPFHIVTAINAPMVTNRAMKSG